MGSSPLGQRGSLQGSDRIGLASEAALHGRLKTTFLRFWARLRKGDPP